MKTIFTLFFLALLSSGTAQSLRIFNGSASANWSDEANWNGNEMPATGDNVLLQADAVADEVSVILGNLEVGPFRRLTVNTSITLNRGLSIAAEANVEVSLDGAIRINDVGDNGIYNGGTLLNSGYINIRTTNTTGIYNGGTVINEGDGTIEFTNNVATAMINTGTTTLRGTSIFYIRSAVKGVHNTGTFSLEGDADLTVNNAQTGIHNDGTFTNSSFITITKCATGLLLGNNAFNNSGSLFIGSNTGPVPAAIENYGGNFTFHNNFGGILGLYGSTTVSALVTIDNAGEINVSGSGINVNLNGNVLNGSLITVLNAVLNIGGVLTNGGGVMPNTGGKLVVKSGGSFTGSGQVHITNGGTFEVNGTLYMVPNSDVLNYGRLQGSGTIEMQGGTIRSQQGSHIAPGNSPGTLTVNGDFDLGPASLDIEVNGVGAGQYDVLKVAGKAKFDEAGLNIIVNYTPANTDKFTFLDATSIASPFATVNTGSFTQIKYDAASGNVSVGQAEAVLPVTLTQFSGKREGGVNKLVWTTATELNNKGFSIERSVDGRVYSSIGFVATKAVDGNSNGSLSYSFSDHTNLSKAYYRLVQTDFDGRKKASAVVVLSGGKVGAFGISALYPNPTKNNLKLLLESSVSGNVKISIVDALGRRVKEQTSSLSSGSNAVVIDVTALASGRYNIRVVNAAGQDVNTAFVKD